MQLIFVHPKKCPGKVWSLCKVRIPKRVIAVQPPPTSEQLPLTSTTKKRSKEISPSDNIPKKTRSGHEIQSQLEATKEKTMEGVEILPRPIIFPDNNRNWPLMVQNC